MANAPLGLLKVNTVTDTLGLLLVWRKVAAAFILHDNNVDVRLGINL